MTPLVPAVAGALVVAGVLGLIVGLRPVPPRPPVRTRRTRSGTRLAVVTSRTRALLAIARHGWLPVKQAVAGGQHEFPRGLFFAGKGPGASHRLVDGAIDGWIGPAARIVHLD